MIARMRYLTEQQASAALQRGVAIEQMLTLALGGDPRTVTWLSASPSDAGVTLRLHHVLDDGSEKFFDVYEFRSVDEDDYLGEGRVVGVYPDAAALEAAVEFGARIDRWLNQGVLQDEYADLRIPK
jgi:hypothetical protein